MRNRRLESTRLVDCIICDGRGEHNRGIRLHTMYCQTCESTGEITESQREMLLERLAMELDYDAQMNEQMEDMRL